jgi:hypothetical protein
MTNWKTATNDSDYDPKIRMPLNPSHVLAVDSAFSPS